MKASDLIEILESNPDFNVEFTSFEMDGRVVWDIDSVDDISYSAGYIRLSGTSR